MEYRPFLPFMVALIFAISAGAFYLAYKSARKKEKDLNPYESLVVRESKVTLVSGIMSIVVFGLAFIGMIVLNFTQGFGDDAVILLVSMGFFGLFFLLGVYLVASWRAWEIRLEGETITLRRLFRNDVVIPLSAIARTEPPVLVTTFGEVRVYDYSGNKLFKVRSTLKGYTLLHGRILAALPSQTFPSAPFPQQPPQYYPNAPIPEQQYPPPQQPFQPSVADCDDEC